MKTYVSVSEAARIRNVTRQSVYLAIKMKRLRAYRHGDRWRIFLMDLQAYQDVRWSRVLSTIDGELIFDESKGCISIEKASQMTGIPKQKLYYAARVGKLKSKRKGKFWVVRVEDLVEYQETYLSKKLTKEKAV